MEISACKVKRCNQRIFINKLLTIASVLMPDSRLLEIAFHAFNTALYRKNPNKVRVRNQPSS